MTFKNNEQYVDIFTKAYENHTPISPKKFWDIYNHKWAAWKGGTVTVSELAKLYKTGQLDVIICGIRISKLLFEGKDPNINIIWDSNIGWESDISILNTKLCSNKFYIAFIKGEKVQYNTKNSVNSGTKWRRCKKDKWLAIDFFCTKDFKFRIKSRSKTKREYIIKYKYIYIIYITLIGCDNKPYKVMSNKTFNTKAHAESFITDANIDGVILKYKLIK